jgi:superfamily II DNA or RNA helicase
MNYKEKIIEILTDTLSWSDVKQKLELYNTAKTETTKKDTEAGKLFEYFAKAYFKIEPEQAQLYKEVWLYDEIPLQIKERLSFPLKDFGIDLLLEDFQNRFYAVQCKFKNDENSVLQWTKDKLGNAFGLAEKCDFVVIFTNASNVHAVAKESNKLKFIGLSNLLEIKTEVINNLRLFYETQKVIKPSKLSPLKHQEIAISKTIAYFENNNRGQLILPCGAGKTLAALWIKENLKAKNTLVLFPSLALLRQFKNEWSWNRTDDFDYVCVCSEKDIDKNTSDSTVTHTYEISGEVTTQPERIKNFLERNSSKIVFSTYQSIESIESALKLLPQFLFDLIICDEAHRTAGSKNKNQFTIVHDNNRIKSKRRLYMTATPKVVSNTLKSRLGDDYELLCDMSNPEIFGNEAYRMSFGEAIQKEILVDYKIIGIGVTHKQVKDFIDQRKYVNSKYSIDEIAHNYALDNVMSKYNASHSISFHSKVQFAKEFVERHSSFFQRQVYSQFVEGNQPTSYRASVLNQFKNSEKGVVSNARCLTEGVDVPTIDLIYFCDPKTSKIDIVQASGRALRKDRHGKKTEGYIVVPIFHYKDDDIEKEIESKPFFQNLVSVIRSLCDQDERLQAEIDEIAFDKGKKKSKHIHITYNDNEIERIIKLDGLESKVREYLFDQIIEKTRSFWELMFKQLNEYKLLYGHTNVSRNQEGMEQLGNWILEQRRQYHLGKIRSDRKTRLEQLGFDWKGENRRDVTDLDEIWKEGYNKLVDYFNENGNSNVPARYSKDKSLGTWCVSQRVKRNEDKLDEWQIELLDKLSFNWKPKNRFNDFVELLERYIKENGDAKVKQSETRYGRLPKWVNSYRTIYSTGIKDSKGNVKAQGGRLTKAQIETLDKIGFLWAERESWDSGFEELKTYFKANGHSNVSQAENPSLYNWHYRQRKNKDSLTPERKDKLKTINFDYTIRDVEEKLILTWEERINQLKEFYEENGDFNIPRNEEYYKNLLNWLSHQRGKQLKGKLTKEQENWFKTINFSLDDFFGKEEGASWEENCERLKKYFEDTGSFYIKTGDKEFGSLLNWIRYQKSLFLNGNLEIEKQNKLKEIGYSFEISYRGKKGKRGASENSEPDETWLKRFEELKSYVAQEDTFLIPNKNRERQTLVSWVQYQKAQYRNGTLGATKTSLLNDIKFPFTENYRGKSINSIRKETNPVPKEIKPSLWDKKFVEFKEYYQNNKTFLIPSDNTDLQSLSSWIRYQRILFRENKLESDKIRKLEELGYSFNLDFRGRKPNDENVVREDWETRLMQLKAYFDENGTFLITKFDNENADLLQWVRYQRLLNTQGKLSEDKLKAFHEIGYSFDLKYYGKGREKKEKVVKVKPQPVTQTWDLNYIKLLDYKMKFGNCNVPRGFKDDVSLSHFVVRQRAHYKQGKLNKDQIRKLEFLGFEWEVNRKLTFMEIWKKNYSKLFEEFKKTGNSNITKGYFDNSLYTWVLQQRMKRKNNELSEEQIKLLDDIAFNWNPEGSGGSPDDDRWFEMLEQLSEYKNKYGDCNVSQLNKDYKKLGRWVNDQRLNYSRGKLLEHRKELLEELDFIWNTKEQEFDLKVKMLQEFYQINGHFEVKQSDLEFGGLYDWLYKIIKKGTTEERKKKLESIGYDTSNINTI